MYHKELIEQLEDYSFRSGYLKSSLVLLVKAIESHLDCNDTEPDSWLRRQLERERKTLELIAEADKRRMACIGR